ncbi:hypothetical protein BDR06DRAFT_1037894 [Suillus hirtellus]|nr:hypothetical protein BDR06DRAFT_1037894 [Suillus hirtellus]
MSDKSSASSSHSLRSRGTVDVVLAAASSATHKPPAMWTKAEEGAFLDFLLLALPSSGDGGFKMPAFNQASTNLKLKFPHQRGAEKSGLVCKTKWQVLKKAYHSVIQIKCMSGFTWSHEHRVGITDRKDDVWARFVKTGPRDPTDLASCEKTSHYSITLTEFYLLSKLPLDTTHPHVKPFIMKGFEHFEIMEQLIPSKAKGLHVFQPTTSTPPLIPTTIDNATRGPPSSVDPDSLEVPPPSTFLCLSTEGSTNSVWTSISHGKRKFSAIAPGSAVSSQKQSRPPSAMLLVQQEGTKMMKNLVEVISPATAGATTALHACWEGYFFT